MAKQKACGCVESEDGRMFFCASHIHGDGPGVRTHPNRESALADFRQWLREEIEKAQRVPEVAIYELAYTRTLAEFNRRCPPVGPAGGTK